METDDGQWRTTFNHLEKSVCPGCPSNERWARELAAEYREVQRAKQAKRPIPAHTGETRLRYWVMGKGWLAEPWGQSDTYAEFMATIPAGKLKRVWSYLKAKVPHLLGLRASSRMIAARQSRCLGMGIRCGQCGKPAQYDSDTDRFICNRCTNFAVPAPLALKGLSI